MIRLRKWDMNVNCEFIIALSRMNFGKRIFKSVLSVHLKLHLFGMSSLWLIAKQQGPDSPLKSIKRKYRLDYILRLFYETRITAKMLKLFYLTRFVCGGALVC